jgi:mannose-1-phosphate guanylyltransferase
MLQQAVDRITPLIAPEHIFIQTAAHLAPAIRAANLGIPAENVLAEPCKRNTSGCLAYAAATLLARYDCPPGALTMAALPADPAISDDEAFRQTLSSALDAAEQEAALVIVGLQPDRPATGYGYIQVAPGTTGTVQRVHAFHEKPDLARAEAYLKDGNYLWNSGMFFWRISTFLDELDTANPGLAQAVRTMHAAMASADTDQVKRTFEGLENVSIDYALMEKACEARVVRATFDWDDIGTWAALDRTHPKDTQGNIVHGDPILVDTTDSIVYNAAGDRIAVAAIGVRDIVIVVTPDAVLVVPKDRSEDVKKAVDELKRRNAPQR